MPSFLYTELASEVKYNYAAVSNMRVLLNRAVRLVNGEIDLRSLKRRAALAPQIYKDVYDYGAPADLKGTALIDIQKQVNRTSVEDWTLVSNEEFDRRKSLNKNLIAISDQDFVKKLRISAEINNNEVVIHHLDSITGDGTVAASGNASNLTKDSDNFVNGSASLNFDMAASYTSGLITITGMNAVDLTDYENHELFLWIYIPTTTGLSSFNLRWGSDATNYWSKSITTNNESLAFYVGWNLLRFDWLTATKTLAPVVSAIDYIRLEIVGSGTASASTDWRIDYLIARIGLIHHVLYYSRYGWQNTAGTYLEDSTDDADLLNCETEELELYTYKGKAVIFRELKEYEEAAVWDKLYEQKKFQYLENNPSERLLMTSTYYEFGTVEGTEATDD